jgi:hypothetical protein
MSHLIGAVDMTTASGFSYFYFYDYSNSSCAVKVEKIPHA